MYKNSFCMSLSACTCKPEASLRRCASGAMHLGCLLLRQVLSLAWSPPNRPGWQDNELQICLCLPGITSVCCCAWLSYMSAGEWVSLTLARHSSPSSQPVQFFNTACMCGKGKWGANIKATVETVSRGHLLAQHAPPHTLLKSEINPNRFRPGVTV